MMKLRQELLDWMSDAADEGEDKADEGNEQRDKAHDDLLGSGQHQLSLPGLDCLADTRQLQQLFDPGSSLWILCHHQLDNSS